MELEAYESQSPKRGSVSFDLMLVEVTEWQALMSQSPKRGSVSFDKRRLRVFPQLMGSLNPLSEEVCLSTGS